MFVEQARIACDRERLIETEKGTLALKLTVSAGLSAHPDDGTHCKDVLRKADGALRRAKASGRNKICLSREDRMVTRTSHYAQEQLQRLWGRTLAPRATATVTQVEKDMMPTMMIASLVGASAVMPRSPHSHPIWIPFSSETEGSMLKKAGVLYGRMTRAGG